MHTRQKRLTYQRLCINMWITFAYIVDLVTTYAQVIHIAIHRCGKLHACNLIYNFIYKVRFATN